MSADAANGKRKREDGGGAGDRRAKERRLKARQEEMEEEFTATYHGLTALYKLLEVKHLRCPLFLPRTLSYRIVGPRDNVTRRASMGVNGKAHVKREGLAPRTAAPMITTATLCEFKIGMTTETIELLKREGARVGLLFSAYAATSDDEGFAANHFELVGSCLVPIPCAKEATLPRELVDARAKIYVVVVQVVPLHDLADKVLAEPAYAFAPAATEKKPLRGDALVGTSCLDGHAPLFGNLLRLNGERRRRGLYSLELQAIAPTMRGVVKLQFRMNWAAPSKAPKMERLNAIVQSKWPSDSMKDEISDELSIPKRIKPSPWTRRGNTNVWFHYLYHSMLRRMSEKRPDYSCAWCNLYAGSLRGLVSHLVSSHSRFRFHVVAGHDNIPHIYVMPRNSPGDGAVAVNPSMCELTLDDGEDMDRIEHHFTYISARKRSSKAKAEGDPVDRMHEFDELEEVADEQKQEFYAPLLQRQYFHSRTGAVVLDHEKDYDSDDDVDEEWITQQSERLLDEFEDVSLEEKEFMKKWNRHVKEYRILADFMVASSCRLFAKLHGKWLLETGLRYNFLLHLFNLWDNSLLNSRAIIDCILIVDHHAFLDEQAKSKIDSKDTTSVAKARVPSADGEKTTKTDPAATETISSTPTEPPATAPAPVAAPVAAPAPTTA